MEAAEKHEPEDMGCELLGFTILASEPRMGHDPGLDTPCTSSPPMAEIVVARVLMVTWDYHIIILMFNVGDSYHDSQWGLSGDSHG